LNPQACGYLRLVVYLTVFLEIVEKFYYKPCGIVNAEMDPPQLRAHGSSPVNLHTSLHEFVRNGRHFFEKNSSG